MGVKMSWLITIIISSIGKKLMMAITGLCFIGFLTIHLIGNLTLYSGQSLFTLYVKRLHLLGPLITLVELGLLLFAIIHILVGTLLFYENLKARPVRYKINKNAGGRTIGSITLPYTGFIILAFVIIHLFDFHFAEHTDESLYILISSAFANPVYVGIYLMVMIVVALHVSHGFWSLFQTLGANHPKYMPFVQRLGIIVSLIFGIGFGFIPLFILFIV